ncbi:beta strand repeat-containing protein, partial [Fusobacterium varium]|uniref:beta strand repeat-containing protein n=1 Tax=Fusobacterium varium TaxID=856 RepID=UPI001F3A1997
TGGTIGQSDSNGVIKAGLIGGNYIKSAYAYGNSITAKIVGGTHVEITGGTFANKVIGGSFVDTYGTTVSGMSVSDDTTDVLITGGTFNNFVIGGGAAAGTDNKSTVGTSNLTIKGGIFNSNIYAGGAALESGKEKNDIGTVSVSNSNLIIDGTEVTEGNLKFSGAIYAGGLNSGVSDTIKLTLKDLKKEVFKVDLDLHGGSRATAGNSIEDGNIEVNILNSSLNGSSYGDLYAGGEADGEGAKVTIGKSSLILNDFSAGKRIFGSGRALNGGILEQGSTDIKLNNTTAGQLYGGGWALNNDENSNSYIKIGTTKIEINGASFFNQVFGGSIISRVGNQGIVSVGKTDITINNGEITRCVAGGNFSNWFGYSVVGIEDTNGNYEYLNGKKYNAGSTNITINNGDMSEAHIIGGNYTEHLSSGYNDYQRKAIVYGDTNININGGNLGLVIGGGEAAFWSGSGNDPATESNVIGTTNINITGGSLSGNIIGGGYAFSDQSSVESIANVTGTTNINISGGTIEKNIYGGGYADGSSATANVNGDTNITISGGDIGGNIYAGGLAENGGTANVTGNSIVTFLNGSTFANSVYGTSKVNSALANNDASKKSTLAFGNDKEKFEGEFKGKFSDFNILRTGKGSVVGIGELNSNNINRDIEITGSGRIKTKINGIGGNIKLTGGTLEIYTEDKENKEDKINFGDKKLTLSDKGILETKSGNIFANALDTEATAVKNSGEVKTSDSIVYTGGSVALNDKKYNLDYLTSAIAAMKEKSESKTSILMLGTLVNTDGEIQGSIDIDQAAGLGDKAVLDNVTVNVDKENLVIGENEGNSDGKVVNNGFNASSLNLGNGSSNNSITLNSENAKVTLGGSGDGELVTVEGKAPTKDINVEVKSGTLVLGSTLSNGANQTLSASVTVGTENGGSGKLEVNAGNQTVTGTIENKESGTVA